MADGECQHCGLATVLVHNVPHLGVFAALCSACVLRQTPGSFCPVCFDAYDEATRPAAHNRVMCLRCPALAHLTCLPSASSFPAFRYLCPPCSDPSFSFTGSEPTAANGTRTVIFAKQHICAAKIAAASMRRAAAVARADAEQKVMGALLARRNAKEALERVAELMSNQQAQDHSDVDDG